MTGPKGSAESDTAKIRVHARYFPSHRLLTLPFSASSAHCASASHGALTKGTPIRARSSLHSCRSD